MPQPAFNRLPIDERRRQLIEAASALFAEHSYEEISMREVAQAAGISKALLYRYFRDKEDLFEQAVGEHAAQLRALIAPAGAARGSATLEEQTARLDAYLTWIEANSRAWSKLMQSASSLPHARSLVESFREETLAQILGALGTRGKPQPVLRTALRGWLGYMDAAILDWVEHGGLDRAQLRELLLEALGGTLGAAERLAAAPRA